MALRDAVKKAIYLNNMLNYINNNLKLGFNIKTPLILVDNTSTIKLAENPEFHKRSKHIDIIYHFSRQAMNNNVVDLKYIPTKLNIADFLTKSVPGPLHKDLLSYANVNNGAEYNDK